MPLYEYQCLACGEKSEVLQRFADPPLAACPKCGGEVKKLLSSPAFQFKGSGFYATDYGAKKGGEPRAGKSDGDGAKSDSKPSGSEKSERSEKAPKSEKSESKAESAKPKEAAASAKD